MRFAVMREKYEKLATLKPNGKAAKALAKELAAQPHQPRPRKPHAERDDNGEPIKSYPVGRQARRSYMHDHGREQLGRSRIQRQTRKRRTGGVQ